MKYPFTIGEMYTRKEVKRIVGHSDPDAIGGDWATGYTTFGECYFIFANTETAGRTGHNYPNILTNEALYWYSKNNHTLDTFSIKQMMSGNHEVYIFTREDSSDVNFIFRGLGFVKDFEDGKPAHVVWGFLDGQDNSANKNFFVTSNFKNLGDLVETYPKVILINDNWNDYGYYTLYHMHYFDEEKKHWEIGDVKILHENEEKFRTIIPTEFDNLSDDYCSLGQTIDFYANLLKLKNNKGIEILKALKDVVIDRDRYQRFKTNIGFSSSLIRFSEAEKALEEAIYLFQENKKQEENFKFTFKYQLIGANAPHEIPFDFTKTSNLPNRINVLIGKNGTGKTQVLSKIAAVVSGYERTKIKNFLPSKPLFSKIIAVSYSVFDEFDRPKKDGELFSYKYCGIRDKENKVVSNQQIKDILINNIELLHKKNRINLWRNFMKEILGKDSFELLEFYLKDGKINLSSGQSLILLTMTELITNIENESLVLFDEPENHLHPNALSKLIQVLNKTLEEFNSFAILSTHSSIVVQEIPSRYIKVIERDGTIPFVRDLHIESFGENLTTITNEVFDVKNNESNYKSILRSLSGSLTYDDILKLFGDNLSYNAVVFLNKLYKDKEKNEKFEI